MRAPRAAKRMLRPLLVKRRFHAFGVGMGKSGSTSLAGVFASNYRAAHEPAALDLIRRFRDYTCGRSSSEQWRRYIERRDRRLWLEMESSQLLVEMLEVLVDRYPESRFVLTIRDPYSWLTSVINHELTQPINSDWRWWADYRYSKVETVPVEEAALLQRGLYTLEGYLGYWARHNERVLTVVPPSRLLVVRTSEISSSLPALADFLHIPARSLDASAAHLRAAESRFDLASLVDTDHLRAAVRTWCGPMVARLFPDVESPDIS